MPGRTLILALLVCLLATLAQPAASQSESPHRIGVRTIDGQAEFFDTATGVRFVPRGANYVDFTTAPNGSTVTWPLATDRFDPERIRAAFQQLHTAYGYNTVRFFIDHCDSGPLCITTPGQPGLNPAYLDNLAHLIRIAAEEGIYLILTSNDLPPGSTYDALAQRETGPTMHGYRNVHFLTLSGLEASRKYWEDLITGLNDRGAPLSAVLGWSLLNEEWVFENEPPLSLDEGAITVSSGRTYGMDDPAQKREMVADALVHYSTTLREQIQQLDPGALVTMGFFTPGFPNETAIGDRSYVDTASLLERAPLDFFDFHTYLGSDISLTQMVENFGLSTELAKPVIMGEVGAFRAQYPSSDLATIYLLDWIAESCEYGFDGWLIWDYYGQDSAADPMWGLLADEGLPLFSLSPVVQPDACVPSAVFIQNVALRQLVGATAEVAEGPADLAVDGTNQPWISGAHAPQGIQIEFNEAHTIGEVRLTVSQFPEGTTQHRVWALLPEDRRVLLGVLAGVTQDGQVLSLELPAPIPNVLGLQVGTIESPSWVSWREIEAFEGDAAPTCLAFADGETIVRARPAGRSANLGTLNPTDGILVAARVEGEQLNWLALNGGGFVREDLMILEGACDDLPTSTETGPATVPVTLFVRGPVGESNDVYIAGAFGDAYPEWDPAGLQMQSPLGAMAWAIQLRLVPGTTIEYKYTRGSWETVELGAACADVPNRTLTVENHSMIVRDQVESWQGTGECAP